MKGLINLPARSTRAGDSIAVKKSKSKGTIKTSVRGGGGGLVGQIQAMMAYVEKNLGHMRDKLQLIRDEPTLINYIDAAIKTGYLSVDTEYAGDDPFTMTLAGVVLHSYGLKGAYIPLHHVSYITGKEVDNQLPDSIVRDQLSRANEHCKVLMFKAVGDIRVLNHQLGVKIKPYWCGYVAAKMLNENEGDGKFSLKNLHHKYVGNTDKNFSYKELFKGIPFTMVPINTAFLYAANDGPLTTELFEFQRPFLTPDDPACLAAGLQDVAKLFHNVEMPLVPIVADMESTGIAFDSEYAKNLSTEYHAELESIKNNIMKMLDSYGHKLDEYRRKMGYENKLEYPINLASPDQVAILLFDVLGIEAPKTKKSKEGKTRSVAEEVLLKIEHPIAKAILEYREFAKLINTYIDKMPESINPVTGRIHGEFNQVGTVTGRFSSSDPNMQNIPAKDVKIRRMFTASEGHYLLSADYSAQEPRITTHLCRDARMIKAYEEGKDLYAEIAGIAFKQPYDECLEFRPDGTKNPDGKKRRGQAKAIVLGVCYGKGVQAIADDLGITKPLAQEIYDTIMIEFPGLKQFMADSQQMATELGYVTTIFGRKRRLPDIQLEKFEFSYLPGHEPLNFDPLDFDATIDTEVPDDVKVYYWNKLEQVRSKGQRIKIYDEARAEGINIKDNTGYIASATRQCVNSRVQGSAGDQIKIAMIAVANDAVLKECGFKLLLQIHDELIGECPVEYVDRVSARFKDIMESAIADTLIVPSVCDVEVTDRWFGAPIDLGTDK